MIIFLLISLILIAGCGISEKEAKQAAEERVESEFEEFSNEIVNYEINATKAEMQNNIWNVMVNVSIIERIEKTELFTSVDGYYIIKVDKNGNIVSSELKQIGSFKP